MSKSRLIISVTFVALALLACGTLPQVELSFNSQATTVPISAPAAAVTPGIPPTLPPPPTPLPQDLIQEADAEERLLINLYERVNPSVVSIQAVQTLEGFQHPALPEGVPTPELPGEPFQQTGEGSGFVVDTQGHIVTNNHVVADTTALRVTFFDGTTVPATIVGTDPDSDLAVIKVDVPSESLRPIMWGDSDQVRVGQRAVAIGNPFGYENTLTSGIISGLSRSLPSSNDPRYRIPEIIQTDAAINPGNSGGPLLNSQGEVIGVTSAIVPNFNQLGERSFLGVGFAIPSNMAQHVLPALIEKGEYAHPWIGFSGMDVLPEIAAEMNLPEAKGALVEIVLPDSPAEQAGLRGGSRNVQFESIGRPVAVGGDVIIRIDDQEVRRFDDVLSYLTRREVGQEVDLTIIRDGETQTVTVTLGRRPSTSQPG
ncbi:MAG: trypsin-like peptidase domain-containing protein [Anaerolineae bacterium]|jgi:2-alkenal reductase